MRSWMTVSGGVFALLLGAGFAAAQEEPEAEASPEPERPAIRVLAHPYDLASFYRSEGSSAPGDVRTNPYAIAGFYRSQSSPGYRPFSAYWTSGTRYWGEPIQAGAPGSRYLGERHKRRPPRPPAEDEREPR